jgi:hypothetical protein
MTCFDGDGDKDAIEQFDPEMRKLQGEPWFISVAETVERMSEVLIGHGVTGGTVIAGAGRLSIGDPLAGAITEVSSIPAGGLAFVVVKPPDMAEALDYMRAVKTLRDRISAANPDAYLLLLPIDWSFRTMQPEMARQFAANMLAFVSDDELARIGLKRMEPSG